MNSREEQFVTRLKVSLIINGIDPDKIVKVPEFQAVGKSVALQEITQSQFVHECKKINDKYLGALGRNV